MKKNETKEYEVEATIVLKKKFKVETNNFDNIEYILKNEKIFPQDAYLFIDNNNEKARSILYGWKLDEFTVE